FRFFHTWSIPLVALASLGVAWCAVFWPWFRNRPEDMQQVNEAERQLIEEGREPVPKHADFDSPKTRVANSIDPPPVFSESLPWSQMLRSPSVWGLCLMYGFVGFAGNFTTNLLPVYLVRHRKLTDETTTLLTGLP